jgi:predicted RNA-binding Zn-ribbon protein involved in translation (DUF1610 family)
LKGDGFLDIEIDFECRECGWVFGRSFLALEHGKSLKCPFCAGTRVFIKSETVRDEVMETDLPEPSPGERLTVMSKIKL